MSLSSVAQETLESVQTFARDLESNGSSLAITGVVLLVGIASQVGVLLRAKNTNPWLLLAVSTGSIITTLSWLAFGARLLVKQERELLVTGPTPTAVAFPEMSVRQISEHAMLAGLLLAVMFVLAGVALSRVLGVAGCGLAARVSAVAAGLSLATLSIGLGRHAFLVIQSFPRGAVNGPVSSREYLWLAGAETARGLRLVGLAFGALLLLAVLSTLVAASLAPSKPSPPLRQVVASLVLLAASAVLTLEALPFYREATMQRLHFNPDWCLLCGMPNVAPQIRGPDRLELAPVVQVSENGIQLGQKTIEVQEISAGLKRMIQQFKELHDAANDSGAFSRATFHPAVLADPEHTGSRLAPVFRQVAIDADSVQLAFVEYWWLDRPVLGRLQAPRESAVLLDLKPVDNSTPLELGADEAYGTFATRAVVARQRGRIHLVLPKE
ncbi:MAG: hypothetical protein Q8S33_20990 [Myxococcales bacterium]|nr:hypothetical protein [Myxococcales bacterium]